MNIGLMNQNPDNTHLLMRAMAEPSPQAGQYAAAPTAAPMAPMTAVPAGPVTGLAPPERNPFGQGMAMAMQGPVGATMLRENETGPWRGKVAAHVVDQLFGGGRKTPVTSQELYAGVAALAPQLLSHKRFMEGLATIGAEHNKTLLARDSNLVKSFMEFGGQMPGEMARGVYDRTGFMLPGVSLAGPGLAPAEPTTQTRSGARQGLFSGTSGGLVSLPSKVQRETTAAGAKATATQQAQTSGHAARRRMDQLMPAGSWATRTDSATGEQKKVWSGGQAQVELGRSPHTVGDLQAQVMAKAREASAKGVPLEQVLNPVELEIYKKAVQSMSGQDLGSVINRLLGGPTPEGPKQITEAKVQEYLQKAGGDKDKARALARQDGYSF